MGNNTLEMQQEAILHLKTIIADLENENLRLCLIIAALPDKGSFDIYEKALMKLSTLGGTRSDGNVIAQEALARAREAIQVKDDGINPMPHLFPKAGAPPLAKE